MTRNVQDVNYKYVSVVGGNKCTCTELWADSANVWAFLLLSDGPYRRIIYTTYKVRSNKLNDGSRSNILMFAPCLLPRLEAHKTDSVLQS